MAAKSFGLGVTVATNDIGGLTNASLGGGGVDFIDTTDHDVSDDARTFVGGLIDSGTLTLEGNFDEDDTGQGYLLDNAAASAACVVTFSDSSTASFSAIIGKMDIDNGGLDDKVTFTCPLKITGAITYASA